jgi:hypothetical protein
VVKGNSVLCCAQRAQHNTTPTTQSRQFPMSHLIGARINFSLSFKYNRPVFISETSMNGTPAQRGRWLDDSIKAVTVMREQNVPLVGYTWWPLFALIDWVYRDGAHPIEGYIARNGPPGLDPAYLSGTLQTLGWNQVEQLPLEAYLAPMGLYELEMQFDGTFARIETPLVDQYRQHIRRFQESSKAIAAGLTDLQ